MYVINNYNDYKEVIYSQDAKHRLKVWFNNVEYQDIDNICERLTIKSRIIPFGSKTFRLENFISKEAELILHDIDINDIQDQVKINIETYVNNDWVSVPMGIFNIQDRPTTDKGKTTITLRDNSVKFDFNYNAQPLIESLGGSATKLQILQDICEQAGVTCNIQSFIGSTDPIGIYDNTKTGRQYISYIAGQGGAIPVINRLGELIFIYINNLTTVDIPMWYVESFKNGDKFKISRVVYESGIIKYEKGTDTYDTLYLDASNPYVSSETQVESILNIVNNFEINSFSTGKILGNPVIDSYDLIELENKSKNLLNPSRINQLTSNGITCSYDENKQIITFNGTCTTDNTTFYFHNSVEDISEAIGGLTTLTAYYVSGSVTTYFYWRINNSSWTKSKNYNLLNIANKKIISNTSNESFSLANSSFSFRFNQGSVANNLKIKIMVANDLDTTYKPYYDNIYKTFACNELVYNGVLIQKFDSEISLEAKQENVTNINNPDVFKKWASTEIDNVKGEISMTTGKVDSLELTTNEQIQQIQEQFDGYTPINTTVELEKSIEQIQTDTYTKIQIDTKLTDGSVTKLKSTLVTTDDTGTTWDKNDSNVKTNVDADGLEIIDKTGSSNEVLLEAKYDSVLGETIVRAKRITVEKYLVVGTHSRFEDYSNGTGCFYLR